MRSDKDYYRILGVEKNASTAEIKKAFKKLARKYHPDFNPGDRGAEKRFKEINEAYQVLSDPAKRRKYDATGEIPFDLFGTGAGGGPGFAEGFTWSNIPFSESTVGGPDLGSFFRNIFEGAGTRRGMEKGKDLLFPLEIDFMTAVRGGKVRVVFDRPINCTSCGGRGVKATASQEDCPRCKGTGKIEVDIGPIKHAGTCHLCRGSGRKSGEPCYICEGSGRSMKRETLDVTIPPGVDTGSRIRLQKKGGEGREGAPSGDLYIELRVRPHPYFHREGDDIALDLPVTLGEAILGSTVTIPTIDGTARLTIPPGSMGGQNLRLKGKGVYLPKGRRGDQYARLTIVLPSKVDEKSKRLIEEFERLNKIDPRSGAFSER